MLLGLVVALLSSSQDSQFKYNRWDAWNSFEEGSRVKVHLKLKNLQTVTERYLKKKEEKIIRIIAEVTSTVREREYKAKPREEQIYKPRENADKPVKCGMCNDHRSSDIKESKEKLKVAGKSLTCIKQQVTMYDCKGNVAEGGRITTWYSKKVPGWIVRVVSERLEINVTEFETP